MSATTTPRPSLNALRAFEATARLGSMTAAAEELFVTHGAVSRHLRALEDQLGIVLLKRAGAATELTPDGARLAEGLGTAFRLIQESIEKLKPGPLTLSCSSSVMMHWLIPRIGGFHEAHPAVEIQLNMNHGRVDFLRDNIGVAIRNTMYTAPPGTGVRELMVERVGPVCAPDYRRSAGLQAVADLARARLLSTKTRPAAWAEWAAAAGLGAQALGPAEPYEPYEHFYLLIQAAACGLGVAAVPEMLVQDELRSGRLVAPFGFVDGPHRIVLWIAPQLEGRADVQVLSRWLAGQMRRPPEPERLRGSEAVKPAAVSRPPAAAATRPAAGRPAGPGRARPR
jgi:LysR family transcriptional regulator, glycine cleavage system transcriptional activator